MNTLTLADLSPQQAGSGSSLMAVNQQLSIGFGIAIGAAMLQYFSQAEFLQHSIQTAFKLTFLGMAIITFVAGFVFACLHQSDGENLVNRQ